MNLHAIYHRPNQNYAYSYDLETIHVRLRTAKNDIEQVTVRFGDPYHWMAGGGGGNLNAEGAQGWISHEIKMKHPEYSRMVELRELVRKEAIEGINSSTQKYCEHKKELDTINENQ